MVAATIPRHLHRPTGHALDRMYAVPNELRSYEDAMRVRHLDLADFSDDALRIEAGRVHLRMLHDADPMARHWLAGRLRAVDAERTRRTRHDGR